MLEFGSEAFCYLIRSKISKNIRVRNIASWRVKAMGKPASKFVWEGNLYFLKDNSEGDEYEVSEIVYRTCLVEGLLIIGKRELWNDPGKGVGSKLSVAMNTLGAAAGNAVAATIGAALLPVVAVGAAATAVTNSFKKNDGRSGLLTLQEFMEETGIAIEDTLIAPAETVKLTSKRAGRDWMTFGMDPANFKIILSGTFLESAKKELNTRIILDYHFGNSQKHVAEAFRRAGFTFKIL